tara:strand:- start:612 stop:1565 length:954 start_codon:yes stop_codon:yes gene_type:complete
MGYNIIFYDTETTGLSVKNDRIVEIAMLNSHIKENRYATRSGKYHCKTINAFETYINTTIPSSKEATAVHGITKKDICTYEEFPAYAHDIITICNNSDYLCSYNGKRFDDLILENELIRSGNEMPTILSIDLIIIMRIVYPSLVSYKLSYVLKILNIKGENKHRAMDDVLCVKSLYLHLLEICKTDAKGLLDLQNKITKNNGKRWNTCDENALEEMYVKHYEEKVHPIKSSYKMRLHLGRSQMSILMKLSKIIDKKHALFETLGNYIQKSFINKIYKYFQIKGQTILEICDKTGISEYNITQYLKKCNKLGFSTREL